MYNEFTTVPVWSCEHVIHSVGSYKRSASLHRLGAVRGLIDADDRSQDEVSYLATKDIYTLPVAEVENLLALPLVFKALAQVLLCSDPDGRLAELQSDLIAKAQVDRDQVCVRYTLRRLDRSLKKVSIDAKDLATLATKFSTEIANIDPAPIFQAACSKLDAAIAANDLPSVLALYDMKGVVLSRVSTRLGLAKPTELRDKLGRLIGEKSSPVRNALLMVLPTIPT